VGLIARQFLASTVVFHAKKDRAKNKSQEIRCQRTFGTFASSDTQAEVSACKRAKFLPTH